MTLPRPLRLTVQYDGTDYAGWQRQDNGRSIQALLEESLAVIEGAPVTVTGAGRTDAGVHALGQVALATMTHTIATGTLLRALNATLPRDIRVLEVADAPPDFHPRYSARSKTYTYRILNSAVDLAFERRWSWHLAAPLDVDAMQEAAAFLVGPQDFASFQGAGSSSRTTERTIGSVVVARRAPVFADPSRESIVAITVTGDGFLRHMVRNIVGTLVEVGQGRRAAGTMPAVLESRDRRNAGATAPPQGLFLVKVEY